MRAPGFDQDDYRGLENLSPGDSKSFLKVSLVVIAIATFIIVLQWVF